VKLAMVSCVFVGGVSGPPAGRSAIPQGLVPARHTAQQLYIALISTATYRADTVVLEIPEDPVSTVPIVL
jgi:hypothetical protein